MVIEEFEKLLKQAMGLDAASIGSSAVERAVQQRMTACKSENLREYWDFVRGSESERQELIEAVVVPETWFFRDRGAFTALGRIVQNDRPSSHSVLRVLSLPSSTGEEAYSIAMALFDAGLTENRFCVDAIDISRRALAQAERAIYGKNSFRGNELGFRERYFEATDQGYRVRGHVGQQVRFQRGNLFAGDFLTGGESYDIVFCRNLLIYFDRATQDRAIEILARLLKPQGVLFVAPSETGLMQAHDFISAKMPLAFAFRKAARNASRNRTDAANSTKLAAPLSRATSEPPVTTKPIPACSPTTSASKLSSLNVAQGEPQAIIEEAAQLADQGCFVEAVKCCEEYLRKNGPSAQPFYLMGLVRDATGNHSEATDCYRKALYLDPDHHEALVHLAFLIEEEGSPAVAQALRERARRVEQKRKA